MFLFRKFKNDFHEGSELFMFFRGLINSHCFSNDILLEYQDYKNLLTLENFNEIYFKHKINRKKWTVFLCASVFNVFCSKNKLQVSKKKNFPISNLESFEDFKADLILLIKSFEKMKLNILSVLKEFFGSKLDNMSDATLNSVTLECQKVFLKGFLKIKKTNCFYFETLLTSCYYFYCLVRGVKNNASLKNMTSLFMDNLDCKVKAKAFISILKTIVYKIN